MIYIAPKIESGKAGTSIGILECDVKVRKKRHFNNAEELEKSIQTCCKDIVVGDLFTNEPQFLSVNEVEKKQPTCNILLRIYFNTNEQDKIAEALQGDLTDKLAKKIENEEVEILSVVCKQFRIIISI